MSAFMVSAATINKAVFAVNGWEKPCEEGDDLGNRLWAMNARAVNGRYANHEPEQTEPFQFSPRKYEDCELLKAVRCLLYQSSECDVPESPLFKQMEQVSNHLAHKIASESCGYKHAPWE